MIFTPQSQCSCSPPGTGWVEHSVSKVAGAWEGDEEPQNISALNYSIDCMYFHYVMYTFINNSLWLHIIYSIALCSPCYSYILQYMLNKPVQLSLPDHNMGVGMGATWAP